MYTLIASAKLNDIDPHGSEVRLTKGFVLTGYV
jgi:hypothetical protein